jgi:hypothetical protein
MKKILYNIILLLGVLVLYSSCSNSDYDEKNFYSSRYHKILLFKDSGKISLRLFRHRKQITKILWSSLKQEAILS